MDLVQYTNLIEGLPFINDEFNANNALKFALLNRKKVSQKNLTTSKYINPVEAIECYKPLAEYAREDFPFRSLNNVEQALIDNSIRRIVDKVPEWGILFQLPIEYRRLTNDLTASSNPIEPQCIYLGETSFSSDVNLDEVLIHEMSHVWIGLLVEAVDVQRIGCSKTYYLPSGTGPRDIRGLCFALTFATAAANYYLKSSQTTGFGRRAEYLIDYALQIISEISADPYVSDFGRFVIKETEKIAIGIKNDLTKAA